MTQNTPTPSSADAATLSVAQNIADGMPVPVICLNNRLEGVYFNAAFASFMEVDKKDTAENTHKNNIHATDILPDIQADGHASIQALQKAMRRAIKDGAYQLPWIIQTFSGKCIPIKLSLAANTTTEETSVNCFLLPSTHEADAAQARNTETDIHLHYIIDDAHTKNPYTPTEEEAQGGTKRDMLEGLPLIMHIWSKDLELLDCTAEATSTFGVADKDEFEQKFFTLCPKMQMGKNSHDLMKEYLHKAFQEGFCNFKWLHQSVEGRIFPCEVTLCRITHFDEECVLGYTQDLSRISSQAQDFSKMMESTRAMLDAAPIAVTLWDKAYCLRDANQECVRLFGFKDADDFVLNYRCVIPNLQESGERTLLVVRNALDKTFKEGYHRGNFSTYHLHNRTRLPLEITLARLSVWNEEMVVAYMRDLRDVKALIKKMQTEEERIQTIFDITPLGIVVWDKTYNIIECNDAMIKMYGFADKKTYMSASYKILPRVQPDGTPTLTLARHMVDKAFETGFAQVEILTFDVKSSPIPVKITAKRAHVQKQDVVVAYIRDLRDLKAKLAEIEAAERELRTARDIAEQNTQAKTQFLGKMSHEIRTPLNGVLGLLHVLQTTQLQPTQQEYVAKSIGSADKLLKLIDNILDFSQIDTGTFEIIEEFFTIADVVNEVKLVYEPQTMAKGLTFRCFVDDTCDRPLLGDAARLKQVIFNIINNAVKFTETGHVTFNVSCTEQQGNETKYIFSVEDSGIGMSKMDTLQIFSAFSQADSSITRKHEGAGLGLAIAKRIVKLMHGDIWVKSHKGKGSTFFFTAPFKRSSIPSGEMHAGDTGEQNAAEYGQMEYIADKPKAYPPKACLGTILLAEDNEINQLIIVELLKNKGYVIDVASNGKETLQMVKEKEYDLVFMDIQMPIMDGLTATAKIRTMKNYEHLPIIAMSAHATSGDRELCIQYGMNDHLSKPINPELLYKTVEKWVRA